MDIQEKIRDALKRIGVDMQKVYPYAQLDNDLEIDSTEAVELVSAIKRFTGVAISYHWCKGKTVQELEDYVETRLRSMASQA